MPDLEAAGYTLGIREPDWYEHRLFKGPDTNVNLHVFSPGSRNWIGWSFSATGCGPTTRIGISTSVTKRELAARDWKFVQHYADAKSEVVEAIIARAQADDEARAAR